MQTVPIEIIENNNKDLIFRTLAPIGFTANDGRWYTIPAGYISDGASVPRIFWPMLSPNIDARTLRPSIIHDYEYEFGIGTRKGADANYRRRLEDNDFGYIKSTLTYYGVRIGGRCHWRAAA